MKTGICTILILGCLAGFNAAAKQIDIKTLPLELSFERIKGNGNKNVYLFCDLDCPHCQRTERILHDIDNVKIHTFVMPVASYHPDAPRKTNAIWCSKNKISAWQDWFDKGLLPEDAKDCSAPLAEIDEYAHGQGIYLPAVIFEDGKTYTAEDFIFATQDKDTLAGLIAEHSKENADK